MFGAACRHEFPLLFFNLKHGERYLLFYNLDEILFNVCRLSYAVYMLDMLLEKFKQLKCMLCMTLREHFNVSLSTMSS